MKKIFFLFAIGIVPLFAACTSKINIPALPVPAPAQHYIVLYFSYGDAIMTPIDYNTAPGPIKVSLDGGAFEVVNQNYHGPEPIQPPYPTAAAWYLKVSDGSHTLVIDPAGSGLTINGGTAPVACALSLAGSDHCLSLKWDGTSCYCFNLNCDAVCNVY